MTRSGLRGSALVLVAALLTTGCSGGGVSAVQSGDGGVVAGSPTPTPSPTPSAAPLPDRANSRSTFHPDPCGVDSELGRDYIDKENHFSEGPADRVQAAAKKQFGARFLGVYIANVKQQYGVGVGVHRLTEADADAFFDATCFRVGDVVFQDGPVSRPQLREWRAEAHRIIFDGTGRAGCSLSDDWRTGTVEVGLREGHPETRAELENAIPAGHLSISESDCPVGW